MKDSSQPSLQRFLNVLNPVRGFGTSFKDRVWSGRRRGVGLLAFPHCGLEKSGPVMGMRLFHFHRMLGIGLCLQFSVFSSLFAGGLRG